jgi:formate hydrogenlyase subunit 6/NADH:ubiquinone oxidoreductase subunit I
MPNQGFISSIIETTKTLWVGIKLTLKHFFQAKQHRKPLGIADKDYFNQQNGIFTTQYPHEAIPIPDNGRNRLHNEIDDCIVCDLCAKICPVDCIEIEAIKSTEEIGKTSDGSVKRLYAAKFDIDLAKCCYCGLCTTVCPTESLTMTNSFDYSEVNVAEFLYHFSDLTPIEVDKKKQLYAEAQKLKAEQKLNKEKTTAPTENSIEGNKKPVFKPTFKPSTPKPSEESGVKIPSNNATENFSEIKFKPEFQSSFKPSLPKPVVKLEEKIEQHESEEKIDIEKSKPVFKPIFKPSSPKTTEVKDKTTEQENTTNPDNEVKPKPVFKPKLKDSEDNSKPS